MTIYGSTLPGAASGARSGFLDDKFTDRAKHKLKVLDWHRSHGNNVSLTARHFGYSRVAIHTWIKAFRHSGVIGLNEQSRAPKKRPSPTTSSEAVMRICQIRKQYPTWSKYKIQEILERDYGIYVSASTVGRVLKRKGLIDRKKSAKRKKAALRPKRRFPRGFSIQAPGDMLQLDTKHITPITGRKMYQFTAIDVLTKYRILRVYSSATSQNARSFLETCIAQFPFSIKNIQTDNGSEFLKHFEKACKELNIPHYFTYPRHPKQNTYVERSHGSDEEEFYKRGNVYQDRVFQDARIQEWQDIWNTFRPHQALGYKTPEQYLKELKTKKLATKHVIILQT